MELVSAPQRRELNAELAEAATGRLKMYWLEPEGRGLALVIAATLQVLLQRGESSSVPAAVTLAK